MRNVIELILTGNSSRLLNALGTGERGLRRFGSTARQEFDRLRHAARSLEGRFASLGLGIGAAMLVKQSAQLDKSLIQIGQTADMSKAKVAGLRKELFSMGRETGQPIEELQQGFNKAVQAGLKFDAALRVTDAVNKASAVTGAQNEILTKSLTSSAAIFNYDLSKPSQALLLLDKMRVAGKQGNAEMEDLAGIMPRVGFGAQRAGMSFEQTMAFVEGLSQAEQEPEKLATLSASWLRLFTNNTYMQKSQKATGVKFFDDKGARRDALAVFADIKKNYDVLQTDAARHSFVSRFLEGADTETITASVAFLGGKFLENARGFSREIEGASGTIERELPDAVRNAVDQTGRLKATLRQAADEFIQPLDKGITKIIKKLLDPKEKGGWELSGKEIAGGGATALLAAYLGKRFGGPMAKKLFGTAVGIAKGKAIEAATGVTPVFVTNWPGSGLNNPLYPSLLKGAGRSIWQMMKPFAGSMAGRALGAVGAGIAVSELTSMFMPGAVYSGPFSSLKMLSDWFYNLQRVPVKTNWNEYAGYKPETYADWVHNQVQNIINVSLNVDQNGRIMAKTDDMKTQLKVLPRGKF